MNSFLAWTFMQLDSEGGEGGFEFRSRDEFRKNLNSVQCFPEYAFETRKETLLHASRLEISRTGKDTVADLAHPLAPADLHVL